MHVRQCLERLREYGLYAKLEKCSFDQRQVEFLRYIVSSNGISMDLAKVQTVLYWQSPMFVQDVLNVFWGSQTFILSSSKII